MKKIKRAIGLLLRLLDKKKIRFSNFQRDHYWDYKLEKGQIKIQGKDCLDWDEYDLNKPRNKEDFIDEFLNNPYLDELDEKN